MIAHRGAEAEPRAAEGGVPPYGARHASPLVPVLTLLANPGTPLPESLRERATNMLKSLLRSGDIHDLE